MIDKQIIQEKISVLQEELGLSEIVDKEYSIIEEYSIILDEAIKQLHFYNELTNILNGEVKSKSEDVVSDENVCDSLKKILMDIFEETHKLDLFSDDFNFREFLHENIDYPIERMKEQLDKPWLRDKLTIGLMGHYATGKTTVLNLLFGESFPVNKHENTALPTYLTYGKATEQVTLIDRNNKSQILTKDQCSVLDFQNGVKSYPFARIFNYMVKENQYDILKKLTIIDTPGLFSTNKEHSVSTINSMPSCDAIFYFINITKSATDDDFKILQQIGSVPLYIIFSFVDARGTTPSEVDRSIMKIIGDIKHKKEINFKGFLKIGRREETRQMFKQETYKILGTLVNEHEVYEPENHVFAVINYLEDFLVKCKSNLSKIIAEIDSETDKLLADYKSSSRTFITEHNNSLSRFNNMVDTFNNRCSGATFCGGASSALCNNINNISESLRRMARAYNSMDESKLVEYGNGCAQMKIYQYKLERVSEILSNVVDLKNKLL